MFQIRRERIVIGVVIIALILLGHWSQSNDDAGQKNNLVPSESEEVAAKNASEKAVVDSDASAEDFDASASETRGDTNGDIAADETREDETREGETEEGETGEDEIKEGQIGGNESSKSAPPIFVHVDGQVKNPGLYQLREGDRVQDAIEVAGGLTDRADLGQVNLSLLLADQMKITIPDQSVVFESEVPVIEGPPGSVAGAESESDGVAPGKVNLNTATIEQLMTLPSIGEKRAQDILRYREEHGFQSVEDLMEISGIGEKTMEKLRGLIEVK